MDIEKGKKRTSPLGHRHGSLTAATRLSLVTDASEAIIADPAPCVDAISSDDPVMDACGFNTATDSDQPPAGGLGRRWLAVACLLVAVFAGVLMPGSFGRRAVGLDGASEASLAFEGSVDQNTRAIEDVRVGDRVVAFNPLLTAADRARFVEPNPRTWRSITLRLPKASGGVVNVTLLRPAAWLESVGAQVGGTIDLDLPELGAAGAAEVLRIGPCPPIRPGSGSVVTGTFAHEAADNVVDLHIEGDASPLGVTTNHPIWSEDRQDFVPVERLTVGERLRTAEGQITRLTGIVPRAGPHTVYNLEVNGEHVYQVGAAGVLVHNTYHDEFVDLTVEGRPAPLHHVATNKNYVSEVRGGPWSPRFEELFEPAGITLDDAVNKYHVWGHRGPHPHAYHRGVYERLQRVTDGLSGEAYKKSLVDELRRIGTEAARPGTVLNDLLTGG